MTTQPAMTVELLPCPFCGGVVYADDPAEDFGNSAYWLSCQDCGREFNNPDTATGWYATREDAAASFNTRAPSPPDGWKLVPMESTDDMQIAFAEVWYTKVRCVDDCEMQDCYKAMLAASPEPPK